MTGRVHPPSWASRSIPFVLAGLCALPLRAQNGPPAPADTIPPAFIEDTAKAASIRAVEAGKLPADSLALPRRDGLQAKLERRGPYLALSGGVSFAEYSARRLFSGHMAAAAAADSQRILQRQDPVHLHFPAGFLAGLPVLPYLDAWVRTEHFRYRVSGLAQRDNQPPTEFWYVLQGHLAGAGARYLVPLSLLSVTGRPGLYAAYTHFWNFGPTGIRTGDGALRARVDAAGAGYEIQAGIQQDFDRRWTHTFGLSFSRLGFGSRDDWGSVLPNAPADPAEWTLRTMRFSFLGMYQFGR